MVKVILVLAALVGSVVCEPPISNYGLNYALNLGHVPLASAYAQPVLIAGHQPYTVASPAYAPTGLNFNLGFNKNFAFGGHHALSGGHHAHAHHGGYGAPAIVKAHHHVAPVVVKKPIVSFHNYDYNAFQPILKKPVVHKGYHGSHFSITPSISYGYSYKLVPTSKYGPVVSGGYGAPAVYKAPAYHGHHGHHHGHGKSLGLDLNLNLGHH